MRGTMHGECKGSLHREVRAHGGEYGWSYTVVHLLQRSCCTTHFSFREHTQLAVAHAHVLHGVRVRWAPMQGLRDEFLARRGPAFVIGFVYLDVRACEERRACILDDRGPSLPLRRRGQRGPVWEGKARWCERPGPLRRGPNDGRHRSGTLVFHICLHDAYIVCTPCGCAGFASLSKLSTHPGIKV